MSKYPITRFHMHIDYGQSPKETLTKKIVELALWALWIIVLWVTVSGCSVHVVRMDPNVGFAEQDGQRRIYVCRYTAEGTRICEYDLEYYLRKDQKVMIVPIPAKTWE